MLFSLKKVLSGGEAAPAKAGGAGVVVTGGGAGAPVTGGGTGAPATGGCHTPPVFPGGFSTSMGGLRVRVPVGGVNLLFWCRQPSTRIYLMLRCFVWISHNASVPSQVPTGPEPDLPAHTLMVSVSLSEHSGPTAPRRPCDCCIELFVS